MKASHKQNLEIMLQFNHEPLHYGRGKEGGGCAYILSAFQFRGNKVLTILGQAGVVGMAKVQQEDGIPASPAHKRIVGCTTATLTSPAHPTASIQDEVLQSASLCVWGGGPS